MFYPVREIILLEKNVPAFLISLLLFLFAAGFYFFQEDDDVLTRKEPKGKRSSKFLKNQRKLCEALEANGTEWFGRSVDFRTNYPVEGFVRLLNPAHKNIISDFTVDLVVIEENGDALIVVQSSAAPHPSKMDEDNLLREAMAEAGIAIAYLGEDPAPEALGMMIKSMMAANAIPKADQKDA